MTTNRKSAFEQLSDQSSALQAEWESRSASQIENSDLADRIGAWIGSCVGSGRFIPTGSAERRALNAILDEWNSRLRGQGFRTDGAQRLVPFDPLAGHVLDCPCPYPGLDPYGEGNRQSFFGRDEQIKAYAKGIEDFGVFLIVGASGSGKSSLALAGVRPYLHSRHPDWLFAREFTPGTHPLLGLCRSIAGEAEAASMAAQLLQEPTRAPSLFAQLCGGRPVLFLVDQLEELMTLCPDRAEQRAFAQALVALGSFLGEAVRFHLLFTLRSDHLTRLETSELFTTLHAWLMAPGHNEYLGALRFSDIRLAIQRPAESVGLRFIPTNIPDRLASETAGLTNGLPLLQYTLLELWNTRPQDVNGRALDIINESMLDGLGDVQAALGKVAEHLFDQLAPPLQEICLRLMLELVVLDENLETPLRRRRVWLEVADVIEKVFGGPGVRVQLEEVAKTFLDAGLLRSFGLADQRTIEVTHEALLRNWSRIRDIVSGEEAKRRLHTIKQIAHEAMDWREHNKSDDRLKQRGAPLETARQYVIDGWIAEQESLDYLRACGDRELELKLRQVNSELFFTGAKVAALLITILFAVVALKVYRNTAQLGSNIVGATALNDRLAAPEALNIAYTIAKFDDIAADRVLEHTLDRMEDAWQMPPEGAALYPDPDGKALLQLDRQVGDLKVFPIDDLGKPTVKPITITIGKERLGRLVRATVGPPAIALDGKRLLLLTFREEMKSGFTVQYALLPDALRASPQPKSKPVLNTLELPPELEQIDDLSSIRTHPDGDKAIFSAIQYGSFDSRLASVHFDPAGHVSIRILQSHAPSSSGHRHPINAVAFGDGDAFVTGSVDGVVVCAGKTIKDGGHAEDSSPILSITYRNGNFAAATEAGRVIVGECDAAETSHIDAARGDPGSVSLVTGESGETLLSYLDTDHQLRCYSHKQAQQGWLWYRCNASQPLDGVMLLKNGWQLSIERGQNSMVRRYPTEQQFHLKRDAEAIAAGGTTLYWRPAISAVESDPALANQGEQAPWAISRTGPTSGPRRYFLSADSSKRLVTDAAVAGNGRYFAWTEWRSVQNLPHNIYSPQTDNSSRKQVSLVRFAEIKNDGALSSAGWLDHQTGLASKVAINDLNQIAHVDLSESGPDKPSLVYFGERHIFSTDPVDGAPRCLSLSPKGRFLVLGTERGGLYRAELMTEPEARSTESAPPAHSMPDLKRLEEAPVGITACAVAEDGTIAVGASTGVVSMFAPKQTHSRYLTKRSAYQFAVPVKQVAMTSEGKTQRITALGSWQVNSCTSASLPGQGIRVWEVGPDAQEPQIPVSNVCFPNLVIAGLGEWQQRIDAEAAGSTDELPTEVQPCSYAEPVPQGMNPLSNLGIELILPDRLAHWHACPGCAGSKEQRNDFHKRLMYQAKAKCARLIPSEEMDTRYGIKLP